MRQSTPNGLNYEGVKNESASVSVEEQNTNFMVNYTLDGSIKTLKKGEAINFVLNPNGTATNLEFNFRFSTPTGGKYTVVVSPVTGFPNNQRRKTFEQQGSIPVIIDYVFLPK